MPYPIGWHEMPYPIGWQELGNTLKSAAAFTVPGAGNKKNRGINWCRQRAATWPQGSRDPALEQQECVQKKDKKARRSKRGNVLLIATALNELAEEDPTKIVIVRKIYRLGFDSAEILKAHFERFGPVNKVRLSNAHAKQPGNSLGFRVRPSGIAFLLFEDAEAAARALAAGDSQVIANVEVFVRGFERRQGDSNSSLGDDMYEEASNGNEHCTTQDAEQGSEEAASNADEEESRGRSATA